MDLFSLTRRTCPQLRQPRYHLNYLQRTVFRGQSKSSGCSWSGKGSRRVHVSSAYSENCIMYLIRIQCFTIHCTYPIPNSSQLVLPTIWAPPPRSRSTTVALNGEV